MHRSIYPVIALVVLAGIVMLALRPVSGSSQDVRTSDVDAVSEGPAVEPVSPFPLLVLWDPWDWRDSTALLQPADPLTLEALPGYEPIEIDRGRAGGFIESTISPDGTAAALVAHIPSDSMEPGTVELHIVDLVEWTDSVVAAWPLSTGYSSSADPAFSADGTRLYWTIRTPGSGKRTLLRYDLAIEVQEELATLPKDFVAHDYRVSPDEKTWYVFGAPVQQDLPVDTGYVLGEFTAGDAQVLIVDLESGEITHTIELEGVAAGGVPIEGLEGDGYPLQNTTPGLDWDLDGKRLYVGHASLEGRATVVDLKAGSVRDQFSLDAGASWLERLANWLAPTARAVVRALSYGNAAQLGDDGVLAVSAATEQLQQDRRELETGAHLPVWAIDTESGDQLWQSHVGGVTGLAEAPNGEHLLVHSSSRIFRLDAFTDDEGQALYLLDSVSGDIVAQVDIPGRPLAGKESMLLSNDLVYVRTNTASGPAVVIVDPDDLSIVGGWQRDEGEPSVYKLLPLP